MAGKVCVKRVTVDYVANGRSFRLEFTDPMKIGSIVLSEVDLARAQAMQTALAAQPGSGVRPVVSKDVSAFETPPGDDGVLIRETTTVISTDPETGPSVWWHNTGCFWTHPDVLQPPADT